MGVHHRDGGTGVVCETLLARHMGLAEAALQARLEAPIGGTELRIAIALRALGLAVFLPQELQGHALAFELLMEGGAVGHGVGRGCGCPGLCQRTSQGGIL